MTYCSPFGGIPGNWKLDGYPHFEWAVACSPFGGIPGNWKLTKFGEDPRRDFLFPLRGDPWKLETKILGVWGRLGVRSCSPFGGIPGNWKREEGVDQVFHGVTFPLRGDPWKLETWLIAETGWEKIIGKFPLRGDPWKLETVKG